MSKKTVNPKLKPIEKERQQPPVKGTGKNTGAHLLSDLGTRISARPYLILAILLFVAVSLIYFPVAYQKQFPIAHDITQWEAAANTVIEYNKTHSDRALWAPNMFSGMPAYMISFPNRYPFLESLTRLTDKAINWRIFLLILGGLGIFVLLKFLGMDHWICFFGAVAFIFSCHWVGLLDIGHNTKFRAIMYIPWVMWALMYLRKKPGLLGMGLLATFLITQLRENHPQITYYLYLFIGMYWVFTLIETFLSKKWKQFILYTCLAIAAFGLTALAVMNPYLSTWEYNHYTMRGGATGLDTAYAQGWSFQPSETMSFIMPEFYGGVSAPVTNDMNSPLRGFTTYWGGMESTQVYLYFGLIVLFFGFFAFWGKHRRFAVFLWIASFLFAMMSFGKYTPFLSGLLLRYLPFFNKFRVPAMILAMVQVNAVILAALGIDTIIDRCRNADKATVKRMLRLFLIVGCIFLIFSATATTIFGGMKLLTSEEVELQKQYPQAAQVFEQLREHRLGMIHKSGMLSMALLTIALGAVYLFSIKKIPHYVMIILLILLAFIDLWPYTGRSLRRLEPLQKHRNYFALQDYDEFLLQDQTNSRIFTPDERVPGRWAYHHRTIWGYSAAKLQIYDNLLNRSILGQFNRYRQVLTNYGMEYPTPVLDMLNTRYIVVSDTLPYGEMLQDKRLVFQSATHPITIYQNMKALPTAWFVDSLKVVTPADSIISQMNEPDFNPARIAYATQDVAGIGKPGFNRIDVTQYDLHEIGLSVRTGSTALMVLSEIYYPAGWKAFIDGEETPIHNVNYVLRGIVVPAGKHEVIFRFDPPSYQTSVRLSLIGLLVTILALGGGIFLHYRQRTRRDGSV